MAVQVAAFGAAFTGALALRLSERFWPDVQEGTIGVAFVLAASLGILLLAGNPHSGEHLQDLLVGQILWVGSAQLAPGAALSAVALALWSGSASAWAGVGAAGYGLGLMASARWDFPAGAMIVCAMAVVGAVVGVLVYALTPRSNGQRANAGSRP